MTKFTVTFYPDNKSVEVDKDRTVLSAALSAGVYVNSACGGDGVCGRCRVIVKKGACSMLPSGNLSAEDKRRGVCLACLTTVQGDCEIEVPPESRVEFDQAPAAGHDRRLDGFYAKAEDVQAADMVPHQQPQKHIPLIEKIYLELTPPDLNDHISDLERLYRSIRRARGVEVSHTGLVNVRLLGDTLRDADWKVTVTLARRPGIVELLGVEAGDRARSNFGFAFDIGTTTVSGQLVDLSSSSIVGTKATYNKQASFGADVITRIMYAQKQEGLEKLHGAVMESINGIIHSLIEENRIDPNDVTAVLCAGNTTMMHLLLRIDPASIRKDPYVPAVNSMPVVRCSEVGIAVNPRALLYCVPGIASYVGGDVTAGVLSCGLDTADDVNLLIDIGTNGEIALGNREFLVATAASAGPAFEGSGVSCGMRSSAGAIQKITIDKDTFAVSYETIGGARPRGICGSGYIDAIAAMLAAGVLDKDGTLRQIPGRVRPNDAGSEFIVAARAESQTAEDIVITEADIENIKRAKAAIYAATMTLMKRLSFEFSRITNIFIAGGFGTSLDIRSAVRIGLLPDVDEKKYLFVGNSSLAGARQQLISEGSLAAAKQIAARMTYLELSVEPGYMDEYMAALFFPHTDLSRFPNF
ncbi:MAG: ASKHA domain-containing protein [Candidatus Omnitrophica bacterium]|nr:ASKHA domain-containing protein [Candidatus Omnitrophota bacterium]